jgi:hypothetical protein
MQPARGMVLDDEQVLTRPLSPAERFSTAVGGSLYTVVF